MNSTKSYYDTAFLQFNNTITSIYNELSNNIKDKYQIMNKRKLGVVMSFYYELLHKNFSYDVNFKSTPFAISLGLNFSVSFGLNVGMEDNSIFINA